MIFAPGAGNGRADFIVQPLDLFATVMNLAGSRAPADMDSHDVLSLAREGGSGKRPIAITGQPPEEDRDVFCTAFDGEWSLTVSPKPEDCVLRRMGEREDVSDDYPEVVERMRDEALHEYERRGADPAVVHWLRTGGEEPFPVKFVPFRMAPKPLAFQPYWHRLYEG